MEANVCKCSEGDTEKGDFKKFRCGFGVSCNIWEKEVEVSSYPEVISVD